MSKKPTVTPGSGNVFADVGLPDAEGELFKAELTYQIAKQIKAGAVETDDQCSKVSIVMLVSSLK